MTSDLDWDFDSHTHNIVITIRSVSCCLAPLAPSSSHAQTYPAVLHFSARDHLMLCLHPWVVRLAFRVHTDWLRLCAAAEVIYHRVQPNARRALVRARNVSTGRPRVTDGANFSLHMRSSLDSGWSLDRTQSGHFKSPSD
jgi:hypothetical protein